VSKIDFRSLFQSNIPSERNPTSDSLVYNTETGTHVLAGPAKHRIAAIGVDGIAPWPKLPPLPLLWKSNWNWTHRRYIKWCHLQWPWTNTNPLFKATLLFVAKYLRNGYRYGYIYYRMRIGYRIKALGWHQFQWHWVTCNPDLNDSILVDVTNLENATR